MTTSSPVWVRAGGSAPALSTACRVAAVVSGGAVVALLLFYAVDLRTGTSGVFGPISDILTVTWDAVLIIVVGGFARTLGTGPLTTAVVAATVALSAAGAVGGLLLTVDVWPFELATSLAVVAILVQSLWLHLLSRRLRSSSWSIGVVRLGWWAPVAQGVGALVVAASLLLGWGSPPQLAVAIAGVALGLPAWATWPVWFALAAREVDRRGLPDDWAVPTSVTTSTPINTETPGPTETPTPTPTPTPQEAACPTSPASTTSP